VEVPESSVTIRHSLSTCVCTRDRKLICGFAQPCSRRDCTRVTSAVSASDCLGACASRHYLPACPVCICSSSYPICRSIHSHILVLSHYLTLFSVCPFVLSVHLSVYPLSVSPSFVLPFIMSSFELFFLFVSLLSVLLDFFPSYALPFFFFVFCPLSLVLSSLLISFPRFFHFFIARDSKHFV
jgi:hypothetical protein